MSEGHQLGYYTSQYLGKLPSMPSLLSILLPHSSPPCHQNCQLKDSSDAVWPESMASRLLRVHTISTGTTFLQLLIWHVVIGDL